MKEEPVTTWHSPLYENEEAMDDDGYSLDFCRAVAFATHKALGQLGRQLPLPFWLTARPVRLPGEYGMRVRIDVFDRNPCKPKEEGR